METKVTLRYARISPRKVRLIADLIRNKNAREAQRILRFAVKRSSDPILKLLNSALANAQNNLQLDQDNLYVSGIVVDGGPMYKRLMPRARGQAYTIRKRTSHVTLVLSEIEPGKTAAPKKASAKAASDATRPALKEAGTRQTASVERKAPEKTKPRKPDVKKEVPRPQQPKGIRRFFRRKSI